MHVTPSRVESIYDTLRILPPFNGFKLPTGENVEIVISRHRDREGHHTCYKYTGGHVIAISEPKVKNHSHLFEIIAHEMIHAIQAIEKTETKLEHNTRFRILAKLACKSFGWDYEAFIQ